MTNKPVHQEKHRNSKRVAAVVVSHNRIETLKQTIDALLNQSAVCDILVVDNASTDGTAAFFTSIEGQHPRIRHIPLQNNVGGAGGFCQGLKVGMSGSWTWFWLMDDDAVPAEDALEQLLNAARDPLTVYGSMACETTNGRQKLSWPMLPLGGKHENLVDDPRELEPIQEVFMIPFLGFFIHRRLVDRIGYPDPSFFISTDDVEYSVRARKTGAKLFLVKSSRISHPAAHVKIYFIGNFRIACRELPPWKLYYETRNRILLASRHYGWRLWAQTIPGVFIRAGLGVLTAEIGRRREVLWMFARALADGVLKRAGKRFLPPSKNHLGAPDGP